MSEQEPRSKPTNFLEIHAGNQPDKMAIIGLERSLTYGQLRKRARVLAQSLYKLGIRPGEQIAIMAYNQLEYAEVANALVYLEVGLVKVGYRMQPPEIEYIVENSDSKLLIFWHEFADRILPFKKNYKKVLPDGFISFGGPSVEGALDFESLFENPPDMDLDALPPAGRFPPRRPGSPRGRMAPRIRGRGDGPRARTGIVRRGTDRRGGLGNGSSRDGPAGRRSPRRWPSRGWRPHAARTR